jgi:hypothetical protein
MIKRSLVRPCYVAKNIWLVHRGIRRFALGRDGRWLLQLYDKNFTRTEMMIRKPVEAPCCSPNLDDFKP